MPKLVVMDLTCHGVGEGQTVDAGDGGSRIICTGRGRRRFTFARSSAGGLDVVTMTEPQASR